MPVDGSAARTISFWAYVDKQCLSNKGTQIIQGSAQIMNVGTVNDEHGNFNLQVFRGNGLRLSTDKQNTHNIFFEGTEELRDAWHHYTIVVEEGGKTEDMRAYVDGKPLPAGQPTDVKINPIDHYVINTTKSAGTLFPMTTGKVADFIVFSRALSAEEVGQVMNATK
ncbi:MAG: LamG domain-containing protein [Rikenellaceae bacterium]